MKLKGWFKQEDYYFKIYRHRTQRGSQEIFCNANAQKMEYARKENARRERQNNKKTQIQESLAAQRRDLLGAEVKTCRGAMIHKVSHCQE